MRYNHSPLHTASFYGFSPKIINKEEEKNDKKINEKKDKTKADSLRSPGLENHKGLHFDDMLEDRVSLIRQYLDKKFASHAQPVMIYNTKPHGKLTLDIIGNSKSIADALCIEAAYAILSDCHKENELLFELNSIGDRESIARFTRELQNYYRKNWLKVPKEAKAAIKKNVFSSFTYKDAIMQSLQENGPKSIGCLSESSRTHLKEVLEYIETLHIPYIINHHLVSSCLWMNDIIVRITSLNEKGGHAKILGCGGRYNSIAKKVFGKKDVPSFGLDLHLDIPLKECAKINYKLFFIQLGFEAKLISLNVLETLRKANIPVFQSLSKDKLTSQISQAEKMKVPYVLLMGKKEALEGSVVVRNAINRSQETILIKDLVAHLKKIL